MKDDNPSSLNVALNYLNRRWRTVREMETKLKEKGFDEAEISATINKLREYHFLDDSRFTEAYIRQRSLLRPSGRYRLIQELSKLGVKREIINEALENVSNDDSEAVDELAQAIEAGRRKLSSYRSLSNEVFRRRLLSFLQRRGFTYDTAKKALAELEKER